MVVDLEDRCGSSISSRYQGVPNMICITMQECGLTSLVACIDVKIVM